jgi:hypothetical protein
MARTSGRSTFSFGLASMVLRCLAASPVGTGGGVCDARRDVGTWFDCGRCGCVSEPEILKALSSPDVDNLGVEI